MARGVGEGKALARQLRSVTAGATRAGSSSRSLLLRSVASSPRVHAFCGLAVWV
jgi:hypothetical protein